MGILWLEGFCESYDDLGIPRLVFRFGRRREEGEIEADLKCYLF